MRVWEFHHNYTFTRGIVSADDPRVEFVDGEGVWSLAGGKLRIEGFGPVGDAVREARERVLGRFVRPYIARPSGPGVVHTVRIDDADTWTLTTDQGDVTTWKRRP